MTAYKPRPGRNPCRRIDGRRDQRWYRKEGFLRSQRIANCEWFGGESGHYWWRLFRWPHTAYRHAFRMYPVGYSRRQGNPKVWSGGWIRPKPRDNPWLRRKRQ